jgi:hypothetical protein
MGRLIIIPKKSRNGCSKNIGDIPNGTFFEGVLSCQKCDAYCNREITNGKAGLFLKALIYVICLDNSNIFCGNPSLMVGNYREVSVEIIVGDD